MDKTKETEGRAEHCPVDQKSGAAPMEQVLERNGIIPLVQFTEETTILPTAEAILAGGIDCVEVAYRTELSGEAIRRIKEAYPSMTVGAGTVLKQEQAEEAVRNGADFLVSPGIQPVIVETARRLGVPLIPGCATPSEVELGLSLGFPLLKFFPAEAAGGVPMLKALSAPYGSVKFMPTGGIGLHNLQDYLALPSVCGCGGSFMFDEHNPKRTRVLTEEAYRTSLALSLGHIGLYNASPEEAERTARILSSLLGVSYDDKGGAIFAGNAFEVLRGKGRGACGHIQILTASIERAERFCNRLGLHFAEDSKAYDKNGKLTLAYCVEEVSGMTLHLSKK